ncbi:hypothetical protein NT6N_10780 [Oceaniferula spumae]|uniref:Peptidase M10 metallopeptidase domain-containing protein n=1 Tax=Oceaniferula spumae TaxID=2979115 RepID=A0AAT9FJ51_9BACT
MHRITDSFHTTSGIPAIFSLKRALLISCLAIPSASAFEIELDYGYDSSSDNFFGTNAAAKSALEQAASDISSLISTRLAPVTNPFVGSNGGTTSTFDWDYVFRNPSELNDPSNPDANKITISSPSLAADTVKIFVGVRELGGSTLGQGSTAGVALSISGGGFPSQYEDAVAAAEAASNASMGRGDGPVIRNISGSTTLGSTTANYSLNVGVGVGSLWFDVDGDNDSVKDSPEELDDFWHFDHTTDVASGKRDFYSVALHEILHVIGVGTSDTWDSQISGTTWTGPNAQLANGGGDGLIDSAGGHIADNTNSVRLSDNGIQEVVMSPSLTTGTRKTLTELDVAFLQDLGYEIVPEPSSAGMLSLSAILLLLYRRT